MGHWPHWPLCSLDMSSWFTFAPWCYCLEFSLHISIMCSSLSFKAQLKCHVRERTFLTTLPNAILSLCQMNPFYFLYRLFRVWNFLACILAYLFFSAYNSYNVSLTKEEMPVIWPLLVGLGSCPAPYAFLQDVSLKGLIHSLPGTGCFGVTGLHIWGSEKFYACMLNTESKVCLQSKFCLQSNGSRYSVKY